jgi:hypothetical protein
MRVTSESQFLGSLQLNRCPILAYRKGQRQDLRPCLLIYVLTYASILELRLRLVMKEEAGGCMQVSVKTEYRSVGDQAAVRGGVRGRSPLSAGSRRTAATDAGNPPELFQTSFRPQLVDPMISPASCRGSRLMRFPRAQIPQSPPSSPCIGSF